MTKRRKQTILGCVLLIVVVALLALAYFHFSPIIREGQKQITVNVVTGGKGETQLSFKTSEKYLRKALESTKTDFRQREYIRAVRTDSKRNYRGRIDTAVVAFYKKTGRMC